MKYKTHILTALITGCLLAAKASYASSCEHDHDHSNHREDHSDHNHPSHGDHDHEKTKAGLNGGRLIATVEPHVEFFVTEEGFVQITFLNKANEVVTPEAQAVSLIGGDRQNPVRIRFKKKGDVLISTEALPKENNLPVILSIKPSKASKTVREKFHLNLSDCPTCDYKEYACTCAHQEDGHEGHAGHDH